MSFIAFKLIIRYNENAWEGKNMEETTKIKFSAPTEEQHIRIQSVLQKRYLQAVTFLPILIMLVAHALCICYIHFELNQMLLVFTYILMLAAILTPLIFHKSSQRDNKATGMALLPFFIMIFFELGIVFVPTLFFDPSKSSGKLFSTSTITVLIGISSVVYILCYLFLIRENLFVVRKLKKREYLILEGTTSGENKNVTGWGRTQTARYILYVLGADEKTYTLRVTASELRQLEVGNVGYIVRFDKTKKGEYIYHYYFVLQ